MAREPKVFAPDQLLPGDWVIGDRLLLTISGQHYVLIAASDEPPVGLHFRVSKIPCEAELAAYQDRVKKRDKPKGFDPDVVWQAVVDFASPNGNGRI